MKYIGVTVLIVGLCVVFYTLILSYGNSKYDSGYKAAMLEVAKNNEAKIVENEKIEKKLNTLDDAALVRRYCKWVYDLPYEQCVKTYKFIP